MSDHHLWWLKRSAISRYTIAAFTVAVTALAVKIIAAFLHADPFVSLFVCAIMFVAWFCGFRPALFATALSIVVSHFLSDTANALVGREI